MLSNPLAAQGALGAVPEVSTIGQALPSVIAALVTITNWRVSFRRYVCLGVQVFGLLSI